MLMKFGEHRCRYDTLMMQLAGAKRHLSYFSGLWANQQRLGYELFWCRDFWYDTASAHMEAVFGRLCRAYDNHKSGINLLTFLRKVERIVEERPDWLPTAEVDRSQLTADICMCEAKAASNGASLGHSVALIRRLRSWRNKIVAHYEDQVAVFEHERFRLAHPWELSDFETLVSQGVLILDRYAFSEGRDVRYTEALAGTAARDIAAKVLCSVGQDSGNQTCAETGVSKRP